MKPNKHQESFFVLTIGGYQPKPKSKPIDPLHYQKSRTNVHKREVYDKHLNSGAEKQLRRVFDTYILHPDGLTDSEIGYILNIFPSTISARRNELIAGEIEGWTVEAVIANGLELRRNGGTVNRLIKND